MTDKCTSIVKHSKVKVEENRSKAVFKNPENREYRVSIVDDCLIKKGIRCDFLVSEIGSASAIVELKGGDVAHACDQLFEAVRHAAVKPLLEAKFGFLIVCTKYPRFDTFVAKAKHRAMKEFKAGFHVITGGKEYDINKIPEIDGPF